MSLTDWNDLHREEGIDAVSAQLRGFLVGSAHEQVKAPAQPSDKTGPEVGSRLYFEGLIAAAGGDFEQLVDTIWPGIVAADLNLAAKEHLRRVLAKAAGTTVASLSLKSQVAYNSDDYVSELNEKHAVVPVGGKVFVMNHEYDPALNRNLVTYSTRGDFELRYMNRRTYIRGESKSVASAWLESKGRAQYEGVVFSPGEEVPGYYNFFQGFGVKPSSDGSCEKFKALMRDVICSGDEALYFYLWHWLAHLFQKPAELPGTSLVFRGKQGTGKSTFIEAIGQLVGTAHYLMLSNIQQVTGKFSGHLVDALLVFANEAIWGGDKTAEGGLKAMITDDISSVEYKGKDIISVKNYKRVLIASNEDWVVPRGLDDRRFIIVDISSARKEDQAYFADIHDELNNGGMEKLMSELMNTDMGAWTPRNIPLNLRENGWELKVQSGGSIMQWWFELIEQGYYEVEEPVGSVGQEKFYNWPVDVERTELMNNYLRWCERHKVRHTEVGSVVGRKLKEWGVRSFKRRINGKQIWHYDMGNVEDLQRKFSELAGIPLEHWDDTAH